MIITVELSLRVSTPLGIYSPGTPVYPLRREGDRVVVCVDPIHLGHRCHTLAVPETYLHVTQTGSRAVAA